MNEYYIDCINGDDSNPGTREKPFKTVDGISVSMRQDECCIYFVYHKAPEMVMPHYHLEPLVFTSYGEIPGA